MRNLVHNLYVLVPSTVTLYLNLLICFHSKLIILMLENKTEAEGLESLPSKAIFHIETFLSQNRVYFHSNGLQDDEILDSNSTEEQTFNELNPREFGNSKVFKLDISEEMVTGLEVLILLSIDVCKYTKDFFNNSLLLSRHQTRVLPFVEYSISSANNEEDFHNENQRLELRLAIGTCQQSLLQYIRNGRRISLRIMLKWILQILATMNNLHAKFICKFQPSTSNISLVADMSLMKSIKYFQNLRLSINAAESKSVRNEAQTLPHKNEMKSDLMTSIQKAKMSNPRKTERRMNGSSGLVAADAPRDQFSSSHSILSAKSDNHSTDVTNFRRDAWLSPIRAVNQACKRGDAEELPLLFEHLRKYQRKEDDESIYLK